jgi:hypothetical protein
MAASANRSEADETTARLETRFRKKNQAELVLAQVDFFNRPVPFSVRLWRPEAVAAFTTVAR